MATKRKPSKIPAQAPRSLDRKPRRGSDEHNYRAMLDHASVDWSMTCSVDKEWHGYAAPGCNSLLWFDANGRCLGYTGMEP